MNRSIVDAIRVLAFASRGKLKSFYLPSYSADMYLSEPVYQGASTMQVKDAGITLDAFVKGPGAIPIRVELKNGTLIYNTIVSSVEFFGDDALTMANPWSVSFTAADVRRISYLYLARLDNDAIEFSWHTTDVAEATFTFRGITQ